MINVSKPLRGILPLTNNILFHDPVSWWLPTPERAWRINGDWGATGEII